MTTENKGVPMTMQITPDLIVDAEAALVSAHERDLDTTRERLGRDGIDTDAIIEEVARLLGRGAVVGGGHGRHPLRTLPHRR